MQRAEPPAPRTAQAAPSPAFHCSFFRPMTDALWDYLGGDYTADTEDHALTISIANGDTALSPHIPPLHHSRDGLNMAARHILLALCFHRCDLHLPDPHLLAPRIAAPALEAWATTAPEQVAENLRRVCSTMSMDGRGEPRTASLSCSTPQIPPCPSQLVPPEQLCRTPTSRPPPKQLPHTWTVQTNAATSRTLRCALERHIVGT